jgi:hypothetical protein
MCGTLTILAPELVLSTLDALLLPLSFQKKKEEEGENQDVAIACLVSLINNLDVDSLCLLVNKTLSTYPNAHAQFVQYFKQQKKSLVLVGLAMVKAINRLCICELARSQVLKTGHTSLPWL